MVLCCCSGRAEDHGHDGDESRWIPSNCVPHHSVESRLRRVRTQAPQDGHQTRLGGNTYPINFITEIVDYIRT